MRAVVARGPGDFHLVDDAVAVRGPRGALIEVEAAGVCAADRMIWRGDGPWDLSFPFIPGHELLGRVLDLDAATARRWDAGPGDRVTAEVMIGCGRCRYCAKDQPTDPDTSHLCRSGRHLGSDLPGAFAERLVLPPEARVHRIPDDLTRSAAVLAEPAACAVHAVRRAAVGAEDVVVVSGIGAIGACVLGALAADAQRLIRDTGSNVQRALDPRGGGAAPKTIVAAVRSAERAERARALGANAAVDTTRHDAADELRDLAGGYGPDAWIECSGDPDAARLATEALAPGGRLVLCGIYRHRAVVDWNLVAEFKELDVRGAHLAPDAFPTAVRLLAGGAIDASLIATHRHALDDLPAALDPTPGDQARLKAWIDVRGDKPD